MKILLAYVVEHRLHVPKWYCKHESNMWIKSYRASKFWIISIRNKPHPLSSSKLSLRIKFPLTLLFKALTFVWGFFDFQGTQIVYVFIGEFHPPSSNFGVYDEFMNQIIR
jgi:hypothetical protein